MKKALVFAMLLPAAGVLQAQNMTGDRITGIAMSNDPAVAAAVERHAQEIAAQQHESASGASGAAGTGASSDATGGGTHKGRAHKMHKSHKGKAASGARQ